MKKLSGLILVLMLLVVALASCSDSFGNYTSEGVIYDISVDGAYAEVVGYDGNSKKIKIEKEYQGLPVLNIYDEAFRDQKKITSVIIPDGITSIGGAAFSGCSRLTSVTIPDSVTTIGEYAFVNCSRLTSVTIPDSVTSISDYMFYGCSSLTSVVLPDGVTSIGRMAFFDCKSLTSIIIPDSVTSIGSQTFMLCEKLSSVVIGGTASYTDSSIFYGCSSLSSVTISEKATNIDAVIFSNCKSLKFNEYDNCQYLGSDNNAYFAIMKVTNNIMKNYKIHKNTKFVASRAFSSCSRLTSVVIPESVTSIGDEAFYKCDYLTDVYYTGTEAEWNKITIGSNNSTLKNATIHYEYVPEK